MIKLHPKGPLLSSFVEGSLPASLSVVIASHIEMCPECQKQVELLTEQAANACFGESSTSATQSGLEPQVERLCEELMDSDIEASLSGSELSMLDAITSITEVEHSAETVDLAAIIDKEIEVSGAKFKVPRALRNIEIKPFQGLGKLSRSRLNIEDGDLRTSLLHIDKGGSVPTHTHKGFEVTLLLQGSFEDEMGVYQAGDFIWLDAEHTHQPVTKTGCVCLTVSNDAIHFTKGVSQLLNPIGQFIY
ncbi:ChrR family anti-sigma-E factor [Shewanella woodyi]|uniref:ChrR family anti-sigma-E factor n=1 Tax=Shewanella woodyi TaxID=60961 RepID=UPI0007F93FE7|nr:ChrR family anti-sigma-E factor [Shewanella woodyi]